MSETHLAPDADVMDLVCDLGVRAVSALRRAGVIADNELSVTPSQIARLSAASLLALPNVGRTTVTHLRAILVRAGLDFAPDATPAPEENPTTRDFSTVNSLRALRLLASMTQVELAKVAGVTQGCISAAELGSDIGISTALRIARALNTTAESIWGDEHSQTASLKSRALPTHAANENLSTENATLTAENERLRDLVNELGACPACSSEYASQTSESCPEHHTCLRCCGCPDDEDGDR